ncbi:hypothetical protein HY484_04245 [Candidatus Woesearchaeota archaeon]|nr:hypothetical protein [Candidatus Woesearchaeota archaeon]
MKFVVDTGAFLSVACSEYFDVIVQEHNLLTTADVIAELKQFAIHDDFLGRKAKQILNQKFVVKKPLNIVDTKLEKAECSVFCLAKEQKCIALTDDAHAARIAHEKLQVATKPSFYLLLLLFKKHKIEKSDLVDNVRRILRYRNWLSGALYEYAIQMLEQL